MGDVLSMPIDPNTTRDVTAPRNVTIAIGSITLPKSAGEIRNRSSRYRRGTMCPSPERARLLTIDSGDAACAATTCEKLFRSHDTRR